MSNYINPWLENFERQILLRRAIIISGNIVDLAFSANNKPEPLNMVINETLLKKGYQHAVFYSRVGGISGVSPSEWDNLQAVGLQSEAVVGDDYDMGDFEPATSLQVTGKTELTPKDFFAVTEKVIADPKRKVAFIIDWSNYLFGQANSLTEAERAWLQQISKTIRDAQLSMGSHEIDKPQSILIFLCSGTSVLPPSLYLNNPLFSEITISLPSIKEREQALLELGHIFSLDEDFRVQHQLLSEIVTQTDGLTIRDIYNLARLSRQEQQVSNINNLVSLYKFGKRQSPWEQLNHQKLEAIKKTLGYRVKGQEHAIEAVYKVLIRAYTGLSGLQHSSKAKTPKGALFFVGPTGVGKTELAKSLAQFLFGDEDACIRFDMSEFNHEHADQRLVGAPPGYVGFEQGGQLTNSVKARPFSLLLFDEIEKAHPRILDKFLQILEDGRLTDGKGETVSFSDTFIVFTSNIGASEILPSNIEQVHEDFKTAVQNHFRNELKRPELLGRIGEANIIPFNFMQNDEILKEIARAKLRPLETRLKEKWQIKALVFEDEDKALQTIVNSVNKQHGGRGILNILTQKLFDPLADFLFVNISRPEKLKNQTIQIIQAGKQFDFDII
ncbi:ATPase [Moraxella osloensis]|uniref:AAA family ATPase n=1 Tax=Moraxella tetraodonis TaxID=2767221 RepID=A0A9X1UTA1_9GAMM|nr:MULTISPECIES: AAA family ATPase [Moraxella]MCG8148602.1 AAA family ATPase [Moraxella tetraodonis]OBX56730.1 ATPase [Moraxella osloensis]